MGEGVRTCSFDFWTGEIDFGDIMGFWIIKLGILWFNGYSGMTASWIKTIFSSLEKLGFYLLFVLSLICGELGDRAISCGP